MDESWYTKTYNTDEFVMNVLNKSYDTDTFFKNLVQNIVNKPFWVKQALYLELRDDIGRMTNVELLEALDKNDLLQLYIPSLTHTGQKIINDKSFAGTMNLTMDMYDFLKQVDGDKNVIDLCYSNNWTLKYFSGLIIDAEKNGYISQIRSSQILNVFKYIHDEIELGDLLVKLNKITSDQLFYAVNKLDEIKKSFSDDSELKLEDILITSGYISRDRISSLLVLKKASEIAFESTIINYSKEIELMQENLNYLTQENKEMVEQISEFKPIIDSSKNKIKELEKEINTYKAQLEDYNKYKPVINLLKKL